MNIMKFRLILILSLLALFNYSLASEYQGQVIFYSYLEKTVINQAQIETDSDFSYHVGNLLKILDKRKIKHQIENKSGFSIITLSGSTIRFNKAQIPISTGYIMIKANGEYLVRSGIGTDIDMMLDIFQFFGIEP